MFDSDVQNDIFTGVRFRCTQRGNVVSSLRVYYVYIMASASGVLYTGVTNHVFGRAATHRAKIVEGFTSKYNVTRLVYYEAFQYVYAAIRREKQIKKFRREKKIALIEAMNPKWTDLFEEYMAGVERRQRANY